jgi:hypothetical protein
MKLFCAHILLAGETRTAVFVIHNIYLLERDKDSIQQGGFASFSGWNRGWIRESIPYSNLLKL